VQDYNQRADLWVVSSGGGLPSLITADAPCTPAFTGGVGAGFVWTPDSRALVYTAAADGKLRLVSRDGGRAKKISDGEGGNASPCVAPDGAFVAYLVDRGDVDEQMFVAVRDLDAPTPATRRITPEGLFATGPQVSPDGTRVACVIADTFGRWSHDAQIAVVTIATGRMTVLTPTEDVVNNAPRWSPDGTTIAFISDRSGFANVWTIAAEGGEARPLAPEPFEQAEPRWSPDGRRIAYTRNENADIQIMVTQVTSGTTEKASQRRGVHTGISWSADGERLYALHQSPEHAPNVVAYSSDGGAALSLIEGAPGGLTDPSAFVYPEHVSWQSSDGTEVYGLLLEPKQITPNKHPALIHIHGGPTSQTMMQWDPISQYWVSRGWTVLKPNFRGSTGYGRTYTDLLHGTWTDLDLEDNVTSINVLRERHLVDERRVVAWGGSGGGLATFACMAMSPGTFAAGVALYGVSDYVNFRHQTDRLAKYLFDAELGPIEENYDLWVQRSPVTHAARTEGPLLVLQGDADRRVPPAQSEAMVDALKKAGKTVEYHSYPGEGHGWRQTVTIRDYLTRMETFLTRYVLDR
ncbi:MAG: prolyl oligopeptidase family serine peptidase, partial [Thermomicrobia bacterium]|nr:prolyl oligopeptidase family serine peptidase [Thermomicrobia bacterium]